MVSPKVYKINSVKSLFHETFLTSTFQNNVFLNEVHYDLRPYKAETFKTNVPSGKKNESSFHCYSRDASRDIYLHETSTLEAHNITKQHKRDLTYSNDKFSSYAQSIKLISKRATTQLVNNVNLDLYSEGATLSKFINEGRPTTTKPTFIAHPSLTSHSTLYECSRSILCKPQDSSHSPSIRLGVIISYSYTWIERSHHHRIPLFPPTFNQEK